MPRRIRWVRSSVQARLRHRFARASHSRIRVRVAAARSGSVGAPPNCGGKPAGGGAGSGSGSRPLGAKRKPGGATTPPGCSLPRVGPCGPTTCFPPGPAFANRVPPRRSRPLTAARGAEGPMPGGFHAGCAGSGHAPGRAGTSRDDGAPPYPRRTTDAVTIRGCASRAPRPRRALRARPRRASRRTRPPRGGSAR